ncbi:MAG: MFS transporter [Promethearchaeota archaeon]
MLELNEKEKKAKMIIQRKIDSEAMKYKSNIWKSYLFHLMVGAHIISGIITIFFMTWGKLSFIEIMYLQSYFWVMILVFEIPCGAISDYISRKFSLFLGGISLTIAALVYSSIPNIVIFVLGETLFAFGEALISGTNTAIMYDNLKLLGREDKIAKFSARNVSFYVAGMGISAPLGSMLTLVIPIELIMASMLIPFFIGAIIALTMKEPNHQFKNQSARTNSYIVIIKSGIKELKKKKSLRTLAFDQVLAEGLIFIVFWTYQPYLEGFGVLVAFLGFVTTLLTFMQVVFMNLVPKLYDHVGNRKKLLLIFTLIPGISFILLSILQISFMMIILFMMIVGFGISRSLIHTKSINTLIETENRATVLSTINMISTLIKAILFPLAGFLVESSLNLAFIVLGLIMILIAIFSRVKNQDLI